MIVLVRHGNGWRAYTGNWAGERPESDPTALFHDALHVYRGSIAEGSYGRCTGDDTRCWCGRPGHIEINARLPYVPAPMWQGSNDGITWASFPGAGPLLVAASCRYAREVCDGEILRYGENAKPPGAPKSKHGE